MKHDVMPYICCCLLMFEQTHTYSVNELLSQEELKNAAASATSQQRENNYFVCHLLTVCCMKRHMKINSTNYMAMSVSVSV